MDIWENFFSIKDLMTKDTNPEVCPEHSGQSKLNFVEKLAGEKAVSHEL
jgi:hypothetical protein